MTVAGFTVTAPDRAVAWADSETYDAAGAVGHTSKISVNALAAAVVIGSGRLAVIDAARAVVGAATSFDDLVSVLPLALSRAALDLTSLDRAAREPVGTHRLGAVGFSHRYGRVVGVVFDGLDGFAPSLARSFATPTIDDDPSELHSVIAAAQAQRRQIAAARGGLLVMAELTPVSVHVGPIFDFDLSTIPRRPQPLRREAECGASSLRTMPLPRRVTGEPLAAAHGLDSLAAAASTFSEESN